MEQEKSPINSYGHLITDHISAMLAYWDKDLVCRFANSAYLCWFGKTSEEMIDKITLPELLGPIYEKNLPYIQGALQGKYQTFEREIPTAYGGLRYSLANYSPDISDGEVRGFFVHVADITSVKLLEKELEISNAKIKEQNNRLLNFANTITHNLKNYDQQFSSFINFLIETDNEERRKENGFTTVFFSFLLFKKIQIVYLKLMYLKIFS